jgi:hypothetical protein
MKIQLNFATIVFGVYEKSKAMGRWYEYQQPAGTTRKLRKVLTMPTAPLGGQQGDWVVSTSASNLIFVVKPEI